MTSFASKQMAELEVNENNNFWPWRYHPETGEKSEVDRTYLQEYFVELTPEIIRAEFQNQKDIQPGDLLINYFDLNHYPYKFEKDGKRWDTPFRIIRLQEPPMKNGSEMKYKLPYNADSTRPFLPTLIVKAYQEGTKVETLVITEGAKKSFYACEKGIPTIGFTSITHYKDKTTGEIHDAIIKFIMRCRVENVVILYDGDCKNISTKKLADGGDLYTRPKSFYSSILAIRELLKKYLIKDLFKLHFAYIESGNIENEPKGLDDLLIECKDEHRQIREEILTFQARSGYYFKKIDVSDGVAGVLKELALNSVETFYLQHEKLIQKRAFKFLGTTYEWSDEKGRCSIVRPGEADDYIRVGDQYYMHCLIPDKFGNLEKRLMTRSKSTILDDTKDRYPKFIQHIPKYLAFCNIPDHVNYQQVIHNCWNSYFQFTYEPKEGDCSVTLDFMKHIFGKEYFDIGMDYVQLLYQNPKEKLPILILVSEEQQTGKSTFLFWLKDIFTENCSIIGNADLQNDFNAFWASRLIVGCEEAFLEKKVIVEKIKALSTGEKITVNSKGKDQYELDFFAKFIFTSNNEQQVVPLTSSDTRYFVVKVPSIEKRIPDFARRLREEIPSFLEFLNKRELSVPEKEDRMWFNFERYRTQAFEKVVTYHKPTAEKEIREALEYVFEHNSECEEILMTAKDISEHVFGGRKFETNYIRRVIEKDLQAEKLKEWYTPDGWFKTEGLIPSHLKDKAELLSHAVRYEFLVVEKRYISDENCYEYLSSIVKSNGRPYVFKRSEFYNEKDKLLLKQADELPF